MCKSIISTIIGGRQSSGITWHAYRYLVLPTYPQLLIERHWINFEPIYDSLLVPLIYLSTGIGTRYLETHMQVRRYVDLCPRDNTSMSKRYAAVHWI